MAQIPKKGTMVRQTNLNVNDGTTLYGSFGLSGSGGVSAPTCTERGSTDTRGAWISASWQASTKTFRAFPNPIFTAQYPSNCSVVGSFVQHKNTVFGVDIRLKDYVLTGSNPYVDFGIMSGNIGLTSFSGTISGSFTDNWANAAGEAYFMTVNVSLFGKTGGGR